VVLALKVNVNNNSNEVLLQALTNEAEYVLFRNGDYSKVRAVIDRCAKYMEVSYDPISVRWNKFFTANLLGQRIYRNIQANLPEWGDQKQAAQQVEILYQMSTYRAAHDRMEERAKVIVTSLTFIRCVRKAMDDHEWEEFMDRLP